mmetsp:Transcript_109755/g.321302  ORF Transcript_109755/g.321302 Transcript_109755/m.321302 type:complete len:209 (+) Transcript_109755:765-1391(+)
MSNRLSMGCLRHCCQLLHGLQGQAPGGHGPGRHELQLRGRRPRRRHQRCVRQLPQVQDRTSRKWRSHFDVGVEYLSRAVGRLDVARELLVRPRLHGQPPRQAPPSAVTMGEACAADLRGTFDKATNTHLGGPHGRCLKRMTHCTPVGRERQVGQASPQGREDRGQQLRGAGRPPQHLARQGAGQGQVLQRRHGRQRRRRLPVHVQAQQ